MTFNKLVLDGRRALSDSSKDMIKHGILLLERALLIGSEDEQLIADINSELGSAYFSLHDFEQAKNFFINDLTTSKRLRNEVKEVEAYSNLSVAYAMLLDFDSSIYCAGRVIILGARLNDDVLKGKGYYNCGFAYLQDALTCSEVDDHSDGTSHLYNQYIREQLQKSVFSFKEYLSIMERQQDKEVSGLALGNLANAYFCLSEYNKSIDCNEKRLKIARDLDDKLAIGRTLINLAKAYNKLGNNELAERNLLAAQRTSKGSDFPEELKAKIEFELETVNKPLDERRTIDDSLSLSSKQSPASRASSYTNKIVKRYCKSVTNLDSLGSRKVKKRFLQTLTTKKLSTDNILGDEGNDGEFMMNLIERSNKQIDDQRVCPEKITKIPLNFDDQSLNSDFASSSGNSRRLSLPRQKLANFKSGAIKSVTNIPKFFSGKTTKRFSKKENVSDDQSMGGSLTSRILKMEVKDD
uniref:Uncharacterized protein n=1 Tax=Meloidogyne enterolobii TaxID=390850 RepID=A0A6V7W4K7_MELEN|nr:unnamed protein product [Meloidogyne enterolobii]